MAFPRELVSLCMIVKDEAATLARVLASAAPWVGELVVVDTGSTDDTVAIAEAHGARVLHFDWVDDFAAARNAGLDAATHRWALVLDADDVLEVVDAAAFEAAVRAERPAAYAVVQKNDDGGGATSSAPVMRLFDRTLPGMRYRGRLHEQVAAATDGTYAQAALPALVIHHDGYRPEAMAAKGKVARNVALASRQVEERPDDPYAWYGLATAYATEDVGPRLDAFARMMAIVEPAIARYGHEAYVEAAFIRWAHDLVAIGAPTAGATLDRALALFPHAPDLMLERAAFRERGGDLAGALADYHACLAADPPADRPRLRDPGAVARTAAAKVALLSAAAVDPLEAARTALAAPAPDVARLAAAMDALLAAGRFDDVEALIQASLPLPAEAWAPVALAWGEVLARRGASDVALALLLEVLAIRPDDPDVLYWIGACAEAKGERDEARSLWEGALAADPGHARAAAALARLSFPRELVSLCMIVKDEAATLSACLESAAPWVGELIVVDTGSTDDTVAIAEAHGARVLHFDWVDDFAAARNAALDAATNPWALVLDADETLEVADPGALAAELGAGDVLAWQLAIHSDNGHGGETVAPVARLFARTHPGLRFRGRLHEQLAAVADGEVQAPIATGARIRHGGYTPAVMAAKGKAARNLRLAERLVAERPDDPYAWFALGTSHEDRAARIAAFEAAARLVRPKVAGAGGWPEALWMMWARDLVATGDPGAMAVLDEGLRLWPDAPDLLFERAELREAGGDAAGAVADYRAVLRAPDLPGRIRQRDAQAVRAAAAARVIALADGDAGLGATVDALAAAAAALAEDPAASLRALLAAGAPADAHAVMTRHLVALAEAGRFDEVEAVIQAAAKLDDATWLALARGWGEAFARRGATDLAIALLMSALEASPQDPDLLFWLGYCAHEKGEAADARNLWQGVLELAPDHALAAEALRQSC